MATEFYLLKKRDNYEPYLKLLEQYPPDDAKLAFRDLCRNDLFFLLVYGMDRTFADNDWFFARCREVQASPDWHIDLWFREGGKSLCITVAKTIQDILNDPEITVGIFSHTRAMAKSFLRVIKREFEINVKLKTAFDDILWADPQKESPKWSEDDGLIVKRSGNPPEPIDCEEPVFTITGWKRHGDLRVGDSVFGADGLPTKVIAVTQKWNDLPCYEVSFGNHSVVAAETHKWEALKRHQSRPMRKAGKLPEDISKIYTTKELKDEISKNKRNRPAVRVTLPLQLPEAMLPIDPYVLGVWLGDGSKDSARFIAETKDFPHLKYEMERAGHTVHIFETRKNAIAYQLDRRDKSKICRRGHDMDVVGRDGCRRRCLGL